MLYFLFSNWFYTYEFNFLNGRFFNGRSRGLSSLLYWASQMLGAFILSLVVEKGDKPNKKRAFHGFFLNTMFLILSWSFAIAIQYTSCNGTVDKVHVMGPLSSEENIKASKLFDPDLEAAKRFIDLNMGYDTFSLDSPMPSIV